jgi:hypothetical protein
MAKKPEPRKTISWDVYMIAKNAVWLGTVEAPDKPTSKHTGPAISKQDHITAPRRRHRDVHRPN